MAYKIELSDYTEERRCEYKGRIYYVRNNGAVYRQCTNDGVSHKYDEVWTFGIPNTQTGYLLIGEEPVHRIVCTAFNGPAPSPQHVVDHIDTNRQNNRPENLRWVTKTENLLSNPITRKRIEYTCGSIEAFEENPDILFKRDKSAKDCSWMRPVTPEEADNSLQNFNNWASSDDTTPKGGSLGEWIYRKPYTQINRFRSKQVDWTQECCFPLCPAYVNAGESIIKEYSNRLEKGKEFLFSTSYRASIEKWCFFEDEDKIRILCNRTNNNGIPGSKPWLVFEISADRDTIYHRHVATLGNNQLAKNGGIMTDLTMEWKRDEWKYTVNSADGHIIR